MFTIAMFIIKVVLCDDVHGDTVRYLAALYDHVFLIVVSDWLIKSRIKRLKYSFNSDMFHVKRIITNFSAVIILSLIHI